MELRYCSQNRISHITMIGNGFRIIVHVHGKPETLSTGCGKLKNKEVLDQEIYLNIDIMLNDFCITLRNIGLCCLTHFVHCRMFFNVSSVNSKENKR